MSHFHTQHQEALKTLKRLELLFLHPQHNAEEIRKQLSVFVGKIRIHFATEYEQLYLKAMASADEQLQTTSKKLFDEMSELSNHLIGHSQKWSQASMILEKPEIFVLESRAIFSALKARITMEEAIFYPLCAKHL